MLKRSLEMKSGGKTGVYKAMGQGKVSQEETDKHKRQQKKKSTDNEHCIDINKKRREFNEKKRKGRSSTVRRLLGIYCTVGLHMGNSCSMP